jgi:type I restriction enzyme S subunit
MKRWPTKPLGELLLTLETGSRPKGGVGELSDGIPSVSGEHIDREGRFYWDTPKHITREFYEGMRRGRIKRGDILVVKDGATTGKTAMVRDNFPFREAAVNEHVFLLRTDQTKALSEFVGYFLFGPVGQQQILSSFRGSAIGGIAQDFVRKVHIPLAPLAEQERLVKLLDEADELRKLRAQADHRAAALIPAIFHEMFGDPTHLEKMRWLFKPVGDFAHVSYGLADKLDATTKPENGTRILTISNVRQNGSINMTVEKYSVVEPAERAKARLQKFDLLFNWRNGSEEHVGKTGIWEGQLEGEILHVSFLLKIRVDQNQVNPYFLWALLNRLRATGYFTRNARMQINRKFNASELSALKLPLPPLPLQNEFVKRVNKIRALQADQSVSRGHLDKLFQSMLHRAFQGELQPTDG